MFILILTFLSACSGGSPSPNATPAPGATTPIEAIKDFFTAVYSGDDPAAYVCSTPNVADEFEIAARVSMGVMPGASVDISGLTFTLKDQTDTQATVTVAGQIVYKIPTNQSSNPFPTSDVKVVNEGGSWKFCGGAG